MYVVGFEALLRSERDLTAEDVTDLVEAIVDDLDRTCGDADVSANGVGSEVQVAIEVVVASADDELDALTTGFSAIHAALHAAEVNTSHLMRATRVRPSVELLSPA